MKEQEKNYESPVSEVVAIRCNKIMNASQGGSTEGEDMHGDGGGY